MKQQWRDKWATYELVHPGYGHHGHHGYGGYGGGGGGGGGGLTQMFSAFGFGGGDSK